MTDYTKLVEALRCGLMGKRPDACEYRYDERTCWDCPFFFHDEVGHGCTYEEDEDGEV